MYAKKNVILLVNVTESEVEGDWPTFDDDDVTKGNNDVTKKAEVEEKVQPKVLLGASLTSGISPKPKPATGMFAKKKKKGKKKIFCLLN